MGRDFYYLCEIYLSGNYGTFTWVDMPAVPKVERPTAGKRLVSSSLKFFGISPIVIMAGALLWPGQLESRGINLSPNMLALILMAWILLTVDATLRLGVVANLVSLAKGIKKLE